MTNAEKKACEAVATVVNVEVLDIEQSNASVQVQDDFIIVNLNTDYSMAMKVDQAEIFRTGLDLAIKAIRAKQ